MFIFGVIFALVAGILFGLIGPTTKIAYKTTFAEQDPPGRFWIDADPLHPLMIRAEMRLARQTDPCPERSEVIPEGPFLQLERDIVVGRTMGRKVTSGIK